MKDKLRELAKWCTQPVSKERAEELSRNDYELGLHQGQKEMGDRILAILDAEAAPRTVTDEDTGVFHDDLMQRESGQRQWSTMGTYQRGCWIAALQAYEERRK